MGAFLSVGKGSSEPSVFLEMKYFGADDNTSSPLVFIGKGKQNKNYMCVLVNQSVILSFAVDDTT